MKMEIPLCRPNIGEKEKEAVLEVLDSGWLASGSKTEEFEKEFASYIGVKKAVSLNSCTSALQLALQSQNITGEVIVPSFTFPASANAIINADAKPVFADIIYNTCNIDPQSIREKITKKTEAIMPVHFAGQSCKMDEVMGIAEKHDLKVIEDSAECLGGTFKGRKTGSFGIGCFSFFPTKNITTGEGGMLTTNDGESVAPAVSALRAHGILKEKEKPWWREAYYSGYNYRMCDVLAAIGLVQLKKLPSMNERRRDLAKLYNKSLVFDEIETLVEDKDCRHVYQMYTIKLDKKIDRDKFVTSLRKMGVGASVHFDPPLHLQFNYEYLGFDHSGALPVTEDVSKRIVTLPMYPQLTKEEVMFVVDSVEKVLKKC